MNKIYCLLPVLIPTFYLCACVSAPDIQPRFTRDRQEVLTDIAATGQFSEYTFEVSGKANNSGLEAKELDLTLVGGKDLPRSAAGLDSLARRAATILVRAIENREEYSLVTVVVSDEDEAEETTSGKQNIFVYFPNELK